jgi:hypothetical protein
VHSAALPGTPAAFFGVDVDADIALVVAVGAPGVQSTGESASGDLSIDNLLLLLLLRCWGTRAGVVIVAAAAAAAAAVPPLSSSSSLSPVLIP